MKKNTFLGINGTRAIVLCTPYTFEQLEQNTADIEESDFYCYATNWGGNDDLLRTLDVMGLKLTGRTIFLPKPLCFRDKDYDNGHEYNWVFTAFVIKEAEKI